MLLITTYLKLRSRIFRLLFFICLCIAGCSVEPNPQIAATAESLLNSPDSYPAFITQVIPKEGTSQNAVEEICATIYTGALIVPGDTGNSVTKQVMESTRFTINGNVPSLGTHIGFSIPRIMYEVVHGVSAGAVIACFSKHFATGIHVIGVTTSGTDGKTYSYTWAFEVLGKENILTPSP